MQATISEGKKRGSNKHRLPEPLKSHVAHITRTEPAISALIQATYLITLAAIAVLCVTGSAYAVLAIPIAIRTLRAMENVGGHEAAHQNICRRNRFLNDCLGNYLSAYFVLTSAQGFRATHLPHHNDFGGPSDPCLSRYAMFSLANARRRGGAQFIVELLRQYPAYVTEYWTGYGGVGRAQVIRAAILHTSVALTGMLFLDWFWLGWMVGVVMPMLILLPYFRMWAESEEHSYDGSPEAEDTFDNGNWFSRWFLHPAGDAHHLLHHILPSVPHWRMAEAHRLFMQLDPLYKNARKRR